VNVFIHTVDVIQCFVKQNMITFNYFVRIKHVFVILLNCKKLPISSEKALVLIYRVVPQTNIVNTCYIEVVTREACT